MTYRVHFKLALSAIVFPCILQIIIEKKQKKNTMLAVHFKNYSTAGDLWSCAQWCVYEIWSLGHKSFERKTNCARGIIDVYTSP